MSQRTDPLPNLDCTLEHFENGRARVRFSDGQELLIARRHLPKQAKEGDALTFFLYTREMAAQEREELARAVLKEILNANIS